MPECRHCNAPLNDAYRFCPMCMTPQTEAARRRLGAYIEQRATRVGGGSTELVERVAYAAAFVAVVAGLSTLPSVGGVCFLLAGVLALPPVRAAVETRAGQPLDERAVASVVVLLGAAGTAAVVLL